MGSRVKMKKMTAFSAIISLVSFLYKMGMGIYNLSLVLMVASLSTLMVFICKVAFVKAITKTREKKKRNYLIMVVATFIYSLIFLLFVVLKVFNIDISKENTLTGWLGALFILFVLVMFILSVINLKGALEKTDIMVIGLKEITFVSALTDLIIIEEFALMIYLRYQEMNDIVSMIDKYLPLGISVLMLLVSIFMFIRYVRYSTDNK